MVSETDWSKPQRQSRVVILIAILKMFKNMWPVIVLLLARFIFNKGTTTDKNLSHLLWGLSGAIILYFFIRLNDIARFFFYRFCITDQQLVIYSGAIVKKKTELPLSKIQAIHTQQTFLHRITNTCRLVIDTAGSEKAEMEIEALDIEVAKQFQQVLTTREIVYNEQQVNKTDDYIQPEQLMQLTAKDILKLCISENHLKTFLIIIGFLVGKMQDISEYLGFDSFGWMQQHSQAVNTTTQTVVFVFILGLLFSIILSCIKVVLRFYGFTIQLGQKHFVMKWGLLETRQKQIPFKKIQLLSWRSTFVRRLMRMYILRLHATAEDENKEDQMIQLPVTNLSQLKKITGYYQQVLPSQHFPFLTIQKQYIARGILLVGLPITLAFITGLYFAIGWYTLLTLLWLFYFIISTYLYRKNYKVWLSNEAIQIEKGVWGRENILVNFRNLQQVSIKTSPYKRKHQLADIELSTTGININIPFLRKEEAAFIIDFTLANIEFRREISQSVLREDYKVEK